MLAPGEKLNNQEAASLLKEKDNNTSPPSPASPSSTTHPGNKNLYKASPPPTPPKTVNENVKQTKAEDTEATIWPRLWTEIKHLYIYLVNVPWLGGLPWEQAVRFYFCIFGRCCWYMRVEGDDDKDEAGFMY